MAVSHGIDPNSYLEICFEQQSVYKAMEDFALVNVHKFFMHKYSPSKGDPIKVLDYGCGPALAYDISPAGINAKIVLAEYSETCHSVLQDWLDRSPSAWDWTPYTKHVICDLEGKDQSEVPKHEEAL